MSEMYGKCGSYKCAMCGGEFHEGRPAAEAEKEAEEIFGVKNASTAPGMSVICDDCFQKINPKKYPALVRWARRILGTE